MSEFDKSLVEVLCCPNCQWDFSQEENYLVCSLCKKKFLIKDGIPILLLD